MASLGTSLRAASPLEILDSALTAVRKGGFAMVGRGLAAGAPLAVCALGIFYLERIEGVRGMRPVFAVLLVAAWFWRAVVGSRLARDYALAIRPTLPMPADGGRPVDIVCTAGAVGLGLWVWTWLLVGAALVTPFAVAGVLPFLAARGAVAPSWLARAASSRARGFGAFGEALDDTAGMRGVFVGVELMVLCGAIGLFGNLYALGSFGVLLGRSMLGLDVAFVSSFLSPDNTLVLLSVAALTLLLLEPLRAATSGRAFVEARSRRDGADLHAAVDAAIASAAPRRRKNLASFPPPAAAVLLASAALWSPASSAAQATTADAPVAEAPDDGRVRGQVRAILLAPEFREFSQSDDRTMREWLQRLFQWLEDHEEARDPQRESLQLPDATPWVLMALALLLLLAIAIYAGGYRRAVAPSRVTDAEPEAISPADAEPGSLLDDAAGLAARGDYRGALRLVYVATLASLDRAGMIRFDPSRTNGQYLRAMPRGEARKLFAAFTRIFDHRWYGHEPATAEDYARCRALAERLREREPA